MTVTLGLNGYPGSLEHVTNNTWYLSFPNPDDQAGSLSFVPGESGAAGFRSDEFGPSSRV